MEISMPICKASACLLAFTLALSAQKPSNKTSSSFTLDQVMSAPFASQLLAAPQGAHVVWLLNERGHRNVWTASAPAWKGRKLTSFDQDDGQEIDDLSWAPDSKYVAFARGGDFETGRENPNPALNPLKPEQAVWAVALDGGAARKLAEGHGPAVSPSGDLIAFLRAGQIYTMKPSGEEVKCIVSEKAASGLKWSPDGSKLAFVSGRGDHSFIGLYTLSTKTLQYLDASVDQDAYPTWSPDGSRIAYVRIPANTRPFAFGPERAGEPWSIRISDVRSGTAREIFRAMTGPGSMFHAVSAGQQLFWSGESGNERLLFPWERSGWCHLYTVSLQGGVATEVTPGRGEVEHVAMSQDGQTAFYSANFDDIDRRHLWTIGMSAGSRPKAVTQGKSIEWAPAPISGTSALAFLASSYNQKAHAMLRAADGKLIELAPETIPEAFPANALVAPQPVLISAADGLEIHGQLFLPTKAGRTHPALIFFHGGSRRQMLLGFHYMEYYSNAYELNQFLASQGYVVLSVNYRSGIGYGLDFREALNYGATGASEFNDVLGAGLYLRSRADVDPKLIGVWGGSYGGYLTALALARASDLFAAGVDFHGVHDWNLEIQNFVPAYDPKGQVDAARIAFESSPLASVKTWRSPVLLIQGDDDRNVPFTETVRLAEALREQHVSFEQLIFPNEIHDFLLYRHWVEAYKATADFFSRKLANQVDTRTTR